VIRRKSNPVILLFFVATMLLLLLSGTASADPAVERVRGTITGDVTWNNNTVYVLDWAVTIAAGSSLTIEPGTVVKLDRSVELRVDGTLNARGTAASPIIFTSCLDDAAGGDTNEDGSATSPQPGDWLRIRPQAGGKAYFDNVHIRYARSGIWYYTSMESRFDRDHFIDELSVSNSEIYNNGNGIFVLGVKEATVDNCTIRDNNGCETEFYAFGMMIVNCETPTFQNNRVLNNGAAGVESKAVEIGCNALSAFTGNTLAGNTQNAVWIWNDAITPDHTTNRFSFTDADATLFNNNVYILYGTTWVSKDTTLTIEPGTVIKGEPGALVVRGELSAPGTSANPIVFTSCRDGSYGGNTRGNDETPGMQDWYGIRFDPDSRGTITGAIIKYAHNALYTNGANVSITGSSISNSQHGIRTPAGSPIVSAKNNWWGAADGPYPYGSGVAINYHSDPVTGERIYHADVIPWLTGDPYANWTPPIQDTTPPPISDGDGGGPTSPPGGGGGGGSTSPPPSEDKKTPAAPAPDNPATVFSDVPVDAWYASCVLTLASEGVINGYPGGIFMPGGKVTRAEFAKMICLVMGWELKNTAESSFKDMPGSHWACRYIETAKTHGVITGYPDGNFKPGDNITRAEIATIIAKALNLPAGSSSLKDIDSCWAKDHINACAAAGIITGYPDGTFKSDNTATRAEAAKMIYGMLEE